MGLSIDPCARLGAESVGGPFGWDGMTLGLGVSRKAVVGIPCSSRNNMVAIGSTVKERALTPRVRFGAYPESARRRPEKVGFPTN
jgi:hypothetical protein